MAAAADLRVEPPLASPELALVDPELGAELRRTHSPVEDRWMRSPAPVEDASADRENALAPKESADDAGHLESGDAEQQRGDGTIVATAAEQMPAAKLELGPSSYLVLLAQEPEEAAFEDSPPRPLTRFDEAPARDDAFAPGAVAVVHREAEAIAEQVLADEYIVATPEHTPEEEERAPSHYPVLPAPQPDAEATDAADAALRRIREGITQANEPPPRKRRIRRGFTLASGAVTLCAVAALAADVQLQVAQLPDWLPF
jgi:hypothetical protein